MFANAVDFNWYSCFRLKKVDFNCYSCFQRSWFQLLQLLQLKLISAATVVSNRSCFQLKYDFNCYSYFQLKYDCNFYSFFQLKYYFNCCLQLKLMSTAIVAPNEVDFNCYSCVQPKLISTAAVVSNRSWFQLLQLCSTEVDFNCYSCFQPKLNSTAAVVSNWSWF